MHRHDGLVHRHSSDNANNRVAMVDSCLSARYGFRAQQSVRVGRVDWLRAVGCVLRLLLGVWGLRQADCIERPAVCSLRPAFWVHRRKDNVRLVHGCAEACSEVSAPEAVGLRAQGDARFRHGCGQAGEQSGVHMGPRNEADAKGPTLSELTKPCQAPSLPSSAQASPESPSAAVGESVDQRRRQPSPAHRPTTRRRFSRRPLAPRQAATPCNGIGTVALTPRLPSHAPIPRSRLDPALQR